MRAALGSARGRCSRACARDPKHWRGTTTTRAEPLDLDFSLSDRIRYYWPHPEVERACARCSTTCAAIRLPLTLLSQYLPVQYEAVRAGASTPIRHALFSMGRTVLRPTSRPAHRDGRQHRRTRRRSTSAARRRARDVAAAAWTAREIAQQPQVWQRGGRARGRDRAPSLRQFLARCCREPQSRIVLTGAGTSASSAAASRRALIAAARRCASMRCRPRTSCGARTSICSRTCRRCWSHSRAPATARRASRPSTLADACVEDVRHLVVTCNADGALGKRASAARRTPRAVLPEETHDRGFAMTSSFSCMCSPRPGYSACSCASACRRLARGVRKRVPRAPGAGADARRATLRARRVSRQQGCASSRARPRSSCWSSPTGAPWRRLIPRSASATARRPSSTIARWSSCSSRTMPMPRLRPWTCSTSCAATAVPARSWRWEPVSVISPT